MANEIKVAFNSSIFLLKKKPTKPALSFVQNQNARHKSKMAKV